MRRIAILLIEDIYIKPDERYKSIPVIMLTTSSSEKDIL